MPSTSGLPMEELALVNVNRYITRTRTGRRRPRTSSSALPPSRRRTHTRPTPNSSCSTAYPPARTPRRLWTMHRARPLRPHMLLRMTSPTGRPLAPPECTCLRCLLPSRSLHPALLSHCVRSPCVVCCALRSSRRSTTATLPTRSLSRGRNPRSRYHLSRGMLHLRMQTRRALLARLRRTRCLRFRRSTTTELGATHRPSTTTGRTIRTHSSSILVPSTRSTTRPATTHVRHPAHLCLFLLC
jgi:hypothetical protein